MNVPGGSPVHVVMPGDVADPAAPSGGNVYDLRVCAGLAALGRPVRRHLVGGSWPVPRRSARAELARTLAAVPDGGCALLDGLVGCGVPEIVVPHARRLRLVVLVHLPLGDEVGADPAAAAELARREGETVRAATAVVATSAFAAQRVAELHGVPAERLHVVTPGTDPAPIATGTDGASRLLAVGAMTPTKGHDVLVAALAAVADLPWAATIAGPVQRDSAHAATVRHLVEVHGLGGRVEIVGPQSPERLATTYAATDLLIQPSRVEMYGMAVAEALARGIPVLASATGGLPSTIGHTRGGAPAGLLVAPGDPSALATALRRWLGDAGMRRRLRLAAVARRGDRTGWGVTSRCLSSILDGVCPLAA